MGAIYCKRLSRLGLSPTLDMSQPSVLSITATPSGYQSFAITAALFCHWIHRDALFLSRLHQSLSTIPRDEDSQASEAASRMADGPPVSSHPQGIWGPPIRSCPLT